MKILVATGIYPPDIGGPATYSKLLSDELPKRGIEVEVLSFGTVRHLPKIIRHLTFGFKLVLRARSVDVIFAQDTVSVGFPSLWVARLLRKKLFVRVPGDHAWEQATQRYGVTDSIDSFQTKKYGWKIEFLRYVQRMTVNGAHTVIAPSVYFRNLVAGWVRSPEKVCCVYNGIDLSVIQKTDGSYEPKTMISAGRLVPWKGFDGLIRALQQLPEWHLSIAGDGPMKSELEKLAQDSGVVDRVSFLGQVPREELISKIQKSELFVLNTFFESFSFQVVEVLAAGTPAIVNNIGNLHEIIDDKKNGFFIEKGNIVNTIQNVSQLLSSDINARKRLAVEAQKKAQQFSIEYTLNNLIHLLQKP